MADIYTGSTGITVTVTVTDSAGAAVDISGATGLAIVIKQMRRPAVSLSASFVTDGTDGQITASTGATALTQPGTLAIQGSYTDGGGNARRTAVDRSTTLVESLT